MWRRRWGIGRWIGRWGEGGKWGYGVDGLGIFGLYGRLFRIRKLA